MTKKIMMAFIAAVSISNVFAQRNPALATYTSDEGNNGFKKQNIFVGGGLNLGFASNTFGAGVNPEIGYSLAPWLDAGISFNLNYASQHTYGTYTDTSYTHDLRQHNFSYGGGPFVRLYPVPMLFLQGQLEGNWSNIKLKDNTSGAEQKYKYKSTSFIAGIGYTQRIIGQSSFYTLIGLDLMNDFNSPYRDYNGAAIPIIKAGFDFYLQPSHKK